MKTDLSRLDPTLHKKGASFVTLTVAGVLRGCIGSVEARRPLGLDVARNAYAAAFRDERFAPLTEADLGSLNIQISVLSQPAKLDAETETELASKLRPRIDGLILEEGPRGATFLPSVWETIPEPTLFIRQLKRKAGFKEDYWSSQLEAFIYTTQVFS